MIQKSLRCFEGGWGCECYCSFGCCSGDREVSKKSQAILANIFGTYAVLEIARKYDVDRIVFVSSRAVYGNPIRTPIGEDHLLSPTNLYGVTELVAERLLESYQASYGLGTVVLRFGNVYGVGVCIRPGRLLFQSL